MTVLLQPDLDSRGSRAFARNAGLLPSNRVEARNRGCPSGLWAGHSYCALTVAVTIQPAFGRHQVRNRSHKVPSNVNNDMAFRRVSPRR